MVRKYSNPDCHSVGPWASLLASEITPLNRGMLGRNNLVLR